MNWLKNVGSKGNHNAFTDLCEFKQQLFCCYREAKDHVSPDGAIRILTLTFSGKVKRRLKISIPGNDLRDPKLTVMPDGNLLLIAYAREVNSDNKAISTQNLCWVSQTGLSWSSVTEFADKWWWLWRVRWHKEQAYGFAYNRGQNTIHLYSGHPKRTFQIHKPFALGLSTHNKGYPNESDLIFEGNQGIALVRRDSDSYSAQLGYSQYPFNKWAWKDLGMYIGGPTLLKLKPGFALAAGRILEKNQLVTAILLIKLSSGEITKLKTLPSKGDNSYPGLVLVKSTLYVSYYSSHESNKSCVYLTSIDVHSILNE